MYLLYKRTFHLSISHFNDQKCYDILWGALDHSAYDLDWIYMLQNTHGHNLKVEIAISGDVPTAAGQDYVVSDEDLERVIMSYNNTNLSVHVDFTESRIRATTENIARLLLDKVSQMSDNISAVQVSVHENDDVVATASMY